jgi:hypothetical protein
VRIYKNSLIVLLCYFCWAVPVVFANIAQIPGLNRDEINDRADSTLGITLDTNYGPFKVQIHFNKKHHLFASRVIDILKNDTKTLVNYFEYAPPVPLHILINGAVNQSNGSATSFPRLTINLFDYPPAGAEHLSISGDWLRNLLLHELVHILHTSQINGVNKVVNYLFGAGRLMPMLVPRWFTEGIAVWAETKFTESGRLRNPSYDWETKRTFLNPSFCNGAGCLDTPGHYPYRQYPYWAGAYFMHSLEREKPGVIRCLVTANSAKVPFFLNSSFEECLGRDAETSYRIFHMEMLERLREKKEKLIKSKQTLDFSFFDFKERQVSLQSGFELVGNKVVFNQNERRDPVLFVYDLDKREDKKVYLEKVLNRIEKNSSELTIGTMPWRGDLPLSFAKFDLETNKSEPLKSNEKYIYLLNGKKKTYGLKYSHMRWRLFEVLPKNEKRKDKQVFIFPEHWQIYTPQLMNNGSMTLLVFNTKLKHYQLYSYHKNKLEKLTKGFAKKEVLYDRFRCGEDLYFRSRNGLYRYANNELFKTTDSMLKSIFFQRVSDEYEVSIYKDDHSGFYYRSSSCKKFAQSYSFYKTNNSEKKKTSITSDLNNSTIKSTLPKSKGYYSLLNLGIDYWLLAFNFDRNLFNTSFETAFTDPATNLSFNLRAIRYWELEENGYQVGSSYRINNNWSAGVSGSKFYTDTGFDDVASYSKSEIASFSYIRNFGRLSYVATTSAAQTEERDFISSRQSNQFGISQGLALAPKKYNEFLPRFNFMMSHTYQDTLNRSQFFGHSYVADWTFKYSPKLSQHFYSTYSKLYKSDFGSGVLYAGRYNQVEVLGIPTNDLFGNEIITARTQMDYLMNRFFKKDSIFPWFTREFRLIAGAEWFKSDFGLLNQRFFGRHSWVSGHAGVRLQSYLAYLIPIDLDLLYTATQDPRDDIFTEFVITAQASWWP